MRVFVTGATGFIGREVVRDLIAHGHQVVGLARSEQSAAALRAAGAAPHAGSVRDLDSLRRGAAEADGVIHLAFTFSFADMPMARRLKVFLGGGPWGIMGRAMAAIAQTDREAIDALGGALQDSGRPLVTTFGVMGLAGGPGEAALRPATEADPPNPRSAGYGRAQTESAVSGWASRGVRASIVRLAPSVHGAGDKGLVPILIGAARKRGEAVYVGEGNNTWCGVHRTDAASLYRLALEKGRPGGVYHGVGDAGLSMRAIAQTIGRRLQIPAGPATLKQVRQQMSFFAPFVATDNPATSLLTQQELGWRPTGPSLSDDLDGPAYFSPPPA
ncbi:MAG TPA: SDR family oxidoreductase [Caulobacteraceae bacterium]|nr:SDR family oxidoreductase [Caulobacteraceae bacterium]